jgi:hypothetical protein
MNVVQVKLRLVVAVPVALLRLVLLKAYWLRM